MSELDAMWERAERMWDAYWRATLAQHWEGMRLLLYERFLRLVDAYSAARQAQAEGGVRR